MLKKNRKALAELGLGFGSVFYLGCKLGPASELTINGPDGSS
jgi:hypothetical protein